MIENINKVPKSQWKKWTPQAQRVFNYLFEQMTLDQNLYLHPRGLQNPPEMWRTTAWNASWMAAEAVMVA